MGDRFRDRVAVVTGAGRGIGRAEAMFFAAEGAAVVVNDLGGSPRGEGQSASPADDVVAAIRAAGGVAVANYGNVAKADEGAAIVEAAVAEFGRIDILVNNAGILRDRMIFNMSQEEWDDVIGVHLNGHYSTIRAASIVFRQQRSGRIINTSSESGLGSLGQANYAAAKEGIIGLTRTVARDLGRYGVTCNAIRPRAATRLVLSDEVRAAVERSESKAIGIGNVEVPLSEFEELKPELVAPFVGFLASDEAWFINGRDFLVAGATISLFTEPTPQLSFYNTEGHWSFDDLLAQLPRQLSPHVRNPWAPAPDSGTGT